MTSTWTLVNIVIPRIIAGVVTVAAATFRLVFRAPPEQRRQPSGTVAPAAGEAASQPVRLG